MPLHSSLLLLLVASVAVSARPLVSSFSMNITDLHLTTVAGGTDNLTFTLLNPEPTGNGSTICTGTWPHGKAEGSSLNCGRWYAASIDTWTAYDNFHLQLKNWFHDPTVGEPDLVTAFAETDVKKPAIECNDQVANATSIECSQPKGTVIEAPIYALTA